MFPSNTVSVVLEHYWDSSHRKLTSKIILQWEKVDFKWYKKDNWGVYVCILPAYSSGGCWRENTCRREELRLTLDSSFVNFTGALGESWGHTPPATATGNFSLLKCKTLGVYVFVCARVHAPLLVGGWYIRICTSLRTSVDLHACSRNLS